MAPSALALGEIAQAGFMAAAAVPGLRGDTARAAHIPSRHSPAADVLFQTRLTLSPHTEDFYVVFLTNFDGKRMCHGVLNFMEILLENNIISRCITLQWPGTWTINFWGIAFFFLCCI